MPAWTGEMISAYLEIKQCVIDAGFAAEIDWQDQQRIDQVTEPELLGEVSWVILSSGMREKVIRRIFEPFSRAMLDWESAKAIWSRRKSCTARASQIFNHQGKIAGILAFVEHVNNQGFASTIVRISENGHEFLQGFPYLGPATSLHLAKNLGLDVVKPDRHLCRIAQAAGADSPNALCEGIAEAVGDRLNVVDVVLWRYATLMPDYLERFRTRGDGDHDGASAAQDGTGSSFGPGGG